MYENALRRAYCFGKLLNFNAPFHDIAPQVVQIMHQAYPEIKEKEKQFVK